MSKLLTPKIHTSSSSTKIPRIVYILFNQNTRTIPTSATPHTPLSPGYSHYTNPALRTTSTTPSSTRIHHLFLSHNTNTYHLSYYHKNIHYFFLKVGRFIRARSSRFGDRKK
nr:MAG TPA: hypothetical protein [Crassvirales sp.]